MTNAYDNWGKNTSREEFLSDLTPYENWQVYLVILIIKFKMENFLNGYLITTILI